MWFVKKAGDGWSEPKMLKASLSQIKRIPAHLHFKEIEITREVLEWGI